MERILFETNSIFLGTEKELKKLLDSNIEKFTNEETYANTQASLVWIIRGCIQYFNFLDNNFLGEGNSLGIPSIEADRFANNFYRLVNSIDYLSKLWNVKVIKPNEFELLSDIRTLIVHSGEQISKVQTLQLKDYKDSQLGRIFRKSDMRAFPFPDEYSDADYCIEIWNDKHDKSKQYNLSQVDYHIENNSYLDCSIYIKASDVRNLILCYIEDFLNQSNELKIETKIKQLPKIREKIINVKTNEIDFEKIAELISKNKRGACIKEQNLIYWKGFGLSRLYEYSKNSMNIDKRVKKIILERIEETMLNFWNDYQNERIYDDDLPSLDIRNVFGEYTPEFSLKDYLENQKLFYQVAPFFNVKDRDDATDVDFLIQFILNVEEALGVNLKLNQSVDGVICDYFVKSIERKLET
ncbi:hypothetical protein [Vagococcus fluvialis]|uniref:hypothetical protein n=1 Tax=Vagococcus fluvialis TaxID=2738 RepID=UPI003D10604F